MVMTSRCPVLQTVKLSAAPPGDTFIVHIIIVVENLLHFLGEVTMIRTPRLRDQIQDNPKKMTLDRRTHRMAYLKDLADALWI